MTNLDHIPFEDLKRGVLRLHELRLSVETRMRALPTEFNTAFPVTTLRLRAWSRAIGRPPCAVYWIRLPPRKRYFEHWLDSVIDQFKRKPRWFRRLKIHTSRQLDRAIHFGGLDLHRRRVREFHARARGLTDARKVLTGTLDTIRKMLDCRGAGEVLEFAPEPLPEDVAVGSYPPDISRLLLLAWELQEALMERQTLCRDLANGPKGRPADSRFRLAFTEDPEHPYGRFLWIDQATGQNCSSLTDRTMRKLRLRSEVRRAIGAVERVRRQRARRLRATTRIIRRIKARVAPALRRAQALLDASGPAAHGPGTVDFVVADHSAEPWEDVI